MEKQLITVDISQKGNARGTKRIIAINANSRGFGFAIMEGAEYLIDWGVVELHTNYSTISSLRRLTKLIDRYSPTVLVHEDLLLSSHYRERTQDFLNAAIALAKKRRIRIKTFTRITVEICFKTHTNHEIAQKVATIFPALVHRLPAKRQLFQSEDYRMSLFKAIAFGLAFYMNS